LGGEVPDEDWRERAADESLREVGRRQNFRLEPIGKAGTGGYPDDRDRGAGGDRVNEQILETLQAIQETLEESKEILQEIKEKEPVGATYGA
jgi:rubrerythrin